MMAARGGPVSSPHPPDGDGRPRRAARARTSRSAPSPSSGPTSSIGDRCRIGPARHPGAQRPPRRRRVGRRRAPSSAGDAAGPQVQGRGDLGRGRRGHGHPRVRHGQSRHRRHAAGPSSARGASSCRYVHVAHDCHIGDGVIIANATQIAGHVTIHDHAILSGLVAVHQFVTIGAYAFVAAAPASTRTSRPYVKAVGNPMELYGLNTIGLQRAGFAAGDHRRAEARLPAVLQFRPQPDAGPRARPARPARPARGRALHRLRRVVGPGRARVSDAARRSASIGVGALGRHHARHLATLEGVRLVGVYDANPETAARVAAEVGAPVVGRARRAARPGRGRLDRGADLGARRGRAPGARAGRARCSWRSRWPSTLAEADALVAAADQRGRRAARRPDRAVQPGGARRAARHREPPVHRGRADRALSPRGTDVSVVLDLMIHDLDLLLALTGSPEVTDVRAVGGAVLSSHLDLVNARLELPGGTVASITASRIGRQRVRRLRIFQASGYLSLDLAAGTAKFLRRPARLEAGHRDQPRGGRRGAHARGPRGRRPPARAHGVRPRGARRAPATVSPATRAGRPSPWPFGWARRCERHDRPGPPDPRVRGGAVRRPARRGGRVGAPRAVARRDASTPSAGPAWPPPGPRSSFRWSGSPPWASSRSSGDCRRTWGCYRSLTADFRRRRWDLYLPIDYPGLPPAGRPGRARRRRIKVLYYIAPQLWAWRPGRARRLAAAVDRLAVVLPFEPAFFARRRARGHLRGAPAPRPRRRRPTREAAPAALGIAPDARVLALFPGSREQEVRATGPPSARRRERLRAEGRCDEVVVAATPAGTLPGRRGARLVRATRGLVLAAADACLAKSGTTTLEAALADVPMVVAYRMNPLTMALARRLVTVEWVSLVNLVAGREVVPEFLQERMTVGALTRHAGRAPHAGRSRPGGAARRPGRGARAARRRRAPRPGWPRSPRSCSAREDQGPAEAGRVARAPAGPRGGVDLAGRAREPAGLGRPGGERAGLRLHALARDAAAAALGPPGRARR